MKTITHEGQEYILKSEVDGIVRERLSKVAESKRTAEKRVSELETQLGEMSSKVQGVDAMASQLAQLQDELSISNQRYERHQAIAKQGIIDPEVRDLIEWQYNKSMESKAKKDKIPLGEWMETMKASGEVPTVLKPYFQAQEAPPSTPSQEAPQMEHASTPSQLQALSQAQQRPSTNQGVAQTQDHATSGDLWKRAGNFEFYQKNREELKKQYYQRRNNRYKI